MGADIITIIIVRMEAGLYGLYFHTIKRVKRVKSFPSLTAHWVALISVSIGPQPDTSLHCKDRGYGASASHGVSVYSPAVRPVPNYTAW